MVRERRGFSLAEVLMASAVGLLLLAVAVSVLVPALRSWLRCRDRATAEQCVLVTLARIRSEFRWSDPNSTAVQPQALSTTLPDGTGARADTLLFWSCMTSNGVGDFDGFGTLQYDQRVAIFLRTDTQEVWMARSYIPQPAASPTPDQSATALAQWNVSAWTPAAPPDQLQRLSSNTVSMSIALLPSGLVQVRLDSLVDDQTATLQSAVGPLQPPSASTSP